MITEKVENALQLFGDAGDRGLTGREFSRRTGVTPGSASGLLSRMHRDGLIVRLQESRDGGGIYVDHAHVRDRATMDRGEKSAPKPKAPAEVVVVEPPVEVDPKVAAAFAEGRELGWQEGYDQGLERANDMDGEKVFNEGRMHGRAEGEIMVRKRVAEVGAEMQQVIARSTPIQTHFNGCYTVHPGCAVKALMRSAGIPSRQVQELSRAV